MLTFLVVFLAHFSRGGGGGGSIYGKHEEFSKVKKLLVRSGKNRHHPVLGLDCRLMYKKEIRTPFIYFWLVPGYLSPSHQQYSQWSIHFIYWNINNSLRALSMDQKPGEKISLYFKCFLILWKFHHKCLWMWLMRILFEAAADCSMVNFSSDIFSFSHS